MNLENKTYDSFTVIDGSGILIKTGNRNHTYLKCRCNLCGEEKLVKRIDLLGGKTNLCDCNKKIRGISDIKREDERLKRGATPNKMNIHYYKKYKKWIPKLEYKNVTYELGKYESFDEAADIMKEAENNICNFLEWYQNKFL